MLRNAPHRIEVYRAEREAIIDGQERLAWSLFATVPGWFTFLDASEAETWREQLVEASVRIPSWVPARRLDEVRIVDGPEELQGAWAVETVRPGDGTTRLLVKRGG